MLDHPLSAFVLQYVQPSEAGMAAFLAHLAAHQFAKGECIAPASRPCDRLHFVASGVARHFFVDQSGNEITSWFSLSGGLATDYRAFTTGAETIFEIQALTPVHTFSIHRHDLEQLYTQFKEWERLGRLVNQHYLIALIERNNGMFMKTARQRYDEFYAVHRQLFNTIPLRYIASYLGITLETLSRLRAEAR
jgi:CRP/FNR family transcriptional regulator, anaerobic regulatory protein